MNPPKSIQARLLDYVKPHWRLFVLGAACSLGVGVSSISLAGVVVLASKAVEARSYWHLGYVCLGVVGFYILRWFLAIGQTVWLGELSQRIGVSMRQEIYAHLQKMSLSYFDNQRTGNLLATFSYDVPVLQSGIMSIKDAIISPVLAIGGLICIFVISWQMTVATALLLPLMALAINRVNKKLRSISLETQNRLAAVNTITEETLSGARLVRAFCAEDREIKRFSSSIQSAKEIAMTGIKRQAVLTPTTDLLGAIGIAAAVFVGGAELISGHGPKPEALLAFLYLIDRVRTGVSGMGTLRSTYEMTMGAADRIFGGVLDVPPAVIDLPNAKPLALTSASVELRNVGFEYIEDRPVLNGVSFTMQPGQVTAIVGASGAGKSTVADLIPRFYDASSGAVLVDGQDVRDVTVLSLRSQMAIVPQETTIFGGTVRENITYGKPSATNEELIEAAKAANAHGFITDLVKGYETIVGERGVMLSGGQRQRIAIARALLKNPRILILDEATSSLDEESQKLVQEALEKLMTGRTTLVIAHRLSTIKNADQIIVMQNGRISERGSHSELIRLGGDYSRMYETQFRAGDDSDMIASAASLLA